MFNYNHLKIFNWNFLNNFEYHFILNLSLNFIIALLSYTTNNPMFWAFIRSRDIRFIFYFTLFSIYMGDFANY